jgi:hypothetical protein
MSEDAQEFWDELLCLLPVVLWGTVQSYLNQSPIFSETRAHQTYEEKITFKAMGTVTRKILCEHELESLRLTIDVVIGQRKRGNWHVLLTAGATSSGSISCKKTRQHGLPPYEYTIKGNAVKHVSHGQNLANLLIEREDARITITCNDARVVYNLCAKGPLGIEIGLCRTRAKIENTWPKPPAIPGVQIIKITPPGGPPTTAAK